MFETLLESRRMPARGTGWRASALSFGAHALVTMWAMSVWSLGPDDDAASRDDFGERMAAYAALRFASVAVPATARAASLTRAARRPRRLLPADDGARLAAPPAEADLAAIADPVVGEIERVAAASSRLAAGPRIEDFRALAGGGGLAEAIARSLSRGRRGDPFFLAADFPAVPLANNPIPVYPPALLAAGVEGEVRVRFVIDTTGALDTGSVLVVTSTDEQFTSAVRAVLPHLRFLPAKSGGTKVPALSEQQFAFVVVLH
ncbi:MAG TPA: TonB family protein [Gemmatimonadaceae bacterium]|nr:TonB family protein [Gemmatimonadaceae bacterium]